MTVAGEVRTVVSVSDCKCRRDQFCYRHGIRFVVASRRKRRAGNERGEREFCAEAVVI